MNAAARPAGAALARRRAGWPVVMLALLPCFVAVQAKQPAHAVQIAQPVQVVATHAVQAAQPARVDKTDRPARVSQTVQPPSAGQREMTLVTLNLHHDREDWPARRAYIAKQLKQLAPDVIALQEVIERRGSVENQAAWLARKLGYEYTFASVDPVGAPKRYGNALLSRRKVLTMHQRLLQPLDDYRVAAHLQVDVDGQPVNVYVTHLNERADARGTATRTRQVADLLDFIASNSDQAPVVIGGDFNTAADALDLEALRKGYGDSYGSVHRNSDATVSTLNMHVFDKPARIDHVFFQQNRLLAREARILFDTPYAEGRWASDHYGVWVRLQLAPGAPAAP